MTKINMTDVDLHEPSTKDGRALCGAKRRQGDHQPCNLSAGHGTDHLGTGRCKYHGGKTPTQRRAITAQLLETKVTQLFGHTYDDKPITDPLTAFAAVSGKVVAFMRVAEHLVAELTSPGYSGELTGEQIRAEVQLFERALDRCNTVLATHARLNIDARLAAITETQGRIVLGAIQAALASAGVTGGRAIEAGRVAAAKMRVLEAEAAAVNPGGPDGAP